MAKPSAYAKKVAADTQEAVRRARWFTMQQCLDMVIIALADELGFGEERIRRFVERDHSVWTEYAMMVMTDSKDDDMIEYTRAKIDGKLKQVCGKYFQPWDERYM